MKKLSSEEARFLQELLDSCEKPTHPLISILFQQLGKLLVLVDGSESYQKTVRRLLNRISKTWVEK